MSPLQPFPLYFPALNTKKTPSPFTDRLEASLPPPKNPQLFSNLSPIHAGISNTPLLKHTAPNPPQTRYNPPKTGTTPHSPLLHPPCPPTASIPQEMPSLPQHPPQNRVQGGLGLPPLKRPLGVHSSQPPQVREDPPNQPCRQKGAPMLQVRATVPRQPQGDPQSSPASRGGTPKVRSSPPNLLLARREPSRPRRIPQTNPTGREFPPEQEGLHEPAPQPRQSLVHP